MSEDKKNKKYGDHSGREGKVEEPAVAYALALVSRDYNMPDAQLSRAMELLGVAHSSLLQVPSAYGYIDIIREGVYKESMDHLMEVTGLTSAEMADLVHTSDRTLRRYKDRHKLNPEQSERLIELARLYARGEEVFEDMELFREWMDTPLAALGHQRPKSFLDTSIGIDMLQKQLQRIEHGTYS